ncbi:10935_t:CDS:2 [Gigaspora rosea]|nr:10935_t:CDS:2 [Gigaspora rosea]
MTWSIHLSLTSVKAILMSLFHFLIDMLISMMKDVFLAPLDLSFSTSQQFNTNYQSKEPTHQQHDEQEPTQLADEQESNEEPDYCDENDGDIIKIDASFPSWKSLENALKRCEVEIEFKSIKYRVEHDNNGDIICRYFVCENSKEHQHKKNNNSTNHRKRESKKVGFEWQLNVWFRKDINSIVVNKLVETHNHTLVPYREEFAPSLRTLSQEVLDKIKFLTQECNLGAKAQRRYISKKYPNQLLYDRDLYNAIPIQSKLEREGQQQRLSEYKNALPTRGLPSVQSVFFKSVQDEIKKYLTLESVSVQNIQISQSILYRASLYEIPRDLASLPNAHEYTEGYLEDEYDALQASLENIINMVNHEDIIEFWIVFLFDQYNHNYPHYVVLLTDNTHLCTCLYIISNGTAASEFDTYEEMNQDTFEELNQVTSIHGSDMYEARIHTSIVQKQKYAHGFGIAKSELKFALENGLVNEFVGLIVRFIESHTGVDTTERMMVDIDKIANKSRQITKASSEDEDIEDGPSKKQVNETSDENSKREAIDNPVDEAVAGYCQKIWITLSADQTTITIKDDGWGRKAAD